MRRHCPSQPLVCRALREGPWGAADGSMGQWSGLLWGGRRAGTVQGRVGTKVSRWSRQGTWPVAGVRGWVGTSCCVALSGATLLIQGSDCHTLRLRHTQMPSPPPTGSSAALSCSSGGRRAALAFQGTEFDEADARQSARSTEPSRHCLSPLQSQTHMAGTFQGHAPSHVPQPVPQPASGAPALLPGYGSQGLCSPKLLLN